MTAPLISTVFDPPLPSDTKATFNLKAFALVSALNTWAGEANVQAEYLDAMADAVGAFEALVGFRGAWSGLTGALSMPASVSHSGNIYALTADVADVTAHTPGVSASWQLVRATSAQITHGAGTVASKFTALDAIVDSGIGAHRNRLINGDFSQNVRALTSVADDTYCLDRWYILTETGSVTVAQLTDPESGAPFGIRLTQPDASPKRMGFASIIESKNIRQYASRAMHLGARLRLSTGANIRYAVIEHTGTADVVTSDVVKNWSSATFTPSNFFIAGLNILSTGTITPGAATWGEVSAWAALSAGVKNVIVFIWTESQIAKNTTLDCSRIQYEPGVVATPHEWRMNEGDLCQPYLPALIATGASSNWGVGVCTNAATALGSFAIDFPNSARVAPTGVTVSASLTNLVVAGNGVSSSVNGVTLGSAGTSRATLSVTWSGGSIAVGDACFLNTGPANIRLLFTGCEL